MTDHDPSVAHIEWWEGAARRVQGWRRACLQASHKQTVAGSTADA